MWTIINFIHTFGLIELFIIFFVMANIITFGLYALDEHKVAMGLRGINDKVLIFFSLGCGGFGAFLGILNYRHKTIKTNLLIAMIIGLFIANIPLVHIVHSFTLDRTIIYKEIDFYSKNWPKDLDGYRIGFITDKHKITHLDMAAVVTELNNRNLDLLLLGGDFSIRNSHYQGTLREISQTITADGIFGVEGNHDIYTRLFRAKEQYGIIPLDNSGVTIRNGFFLAGVQDLWNRNPDIEEAIAGASADDFILLISHNPDVAMMQPTSGIDLIVAGHTHRGQITFFGYSFYLLRGSISDYGTKFAYGFSYSNEGTPVFTSSGVGVYYSWPRIFARPEVVIFTMYNIE